MLETDQVENYMNSLSVFGDEEETILETSNYQSLGTKKTSLINQLTQYTSIYNSYLRGAQYYQTQVTSLENSKSMIEKKISSTENNIKSAETTKKLFYSRYVYYKNRVSIYRRYGSRYARYVSSYGRITNVYLQKYNTYLQMIQTLTKELTNERTNLSKITSDWLIKQRYLAIINMLQVHGIVELKVKRKKLKKLIKKLKILKIDKF